MKTDESIANTDCGRDSQTQMWELIFVFRGLFPQQERCSISNQFSFTAFKKQLE